MNGFSDKSGDAIKAHKIFSTNYNILLTMLNDIHTDIHSARESLDMLVLVEEEKSKENFLRLIILPRVFLSAPITLAT